MTSSMVVGRRLLAQTSVFTKLPSTVSGINNRHNNIHLSTPRALPRAATLRLPDNVQDLSSETGCFSQLRARDISGSVISSSQNYHERYTSPRIDVTSESDPHIGPYDCRGALSLSSSMQSNVPSPFGGQSSILSMPGSQLEQNYKWVSDNLHTLHYLNLRNEYANFKSGTHQYHTMAAHKSSLLRYGTVNSLLGSRTKATADNWLDEKPLSRAEQLKRAVKTYGTTVVVFHVAISLASLGGFYLLVSSGLDILPWIEKLGFGENRVKEITASAGTFVIAYSVHKLFAPVRIGITLTATPFIVNYLRKHKILKTPKV